MQALPPAPTNVEFDQDASYIIVGGLGGLGQAICRWMVSRGCKNIVALSRSGMNSANAISFQDELEIRGVKLIAYACDVSNGQEVERVLSSCAQEMPPFKGLIQSAMVIRVRNFFLHPSSWHKGTLILHPFFHYLNPGQTRG